MNNPKAKKKYNILMLSFEKFRGDVSELSKRDDLEVYKISNLWLSRLFLIFYGYRKSNEKITPKKLYTNKSDKQFEKKQKKYHKFLKILLNKIRLDLKINCLLSADVRYISDIDLGLVSEKIGLPYIVLHRENLFACENIYNLVLERWKKWGEFKGSKIIVHNEITKKLFMQSGFVPKKKEKKIEVGGCLRMDSLFKKFKEKKNSDENSITFFSFWNQAYSNWPKSIFHNSHQEVVRFARNNPEIRVYIKPKLRNYEKNDHWRNAFYDSAKDVSKNIKQIENLIVSPYLDSTNLILNSKFIISLNSTVILEAAIIGKPVIIPYFNEIRNKKYQNTIYFLNFMECFDTPCNAKKMYENMTFRLKNNKTEKHIMNKRKKLFNIYLHSHTKSISDKYFKIINSVIN